MISSIYDPLGFAAPFILEGKRISQELYNQDLQWDSEVSSFVKKDWKNWITKLRHIEGLHVRRCMKPDNFGKVVMLVSIIFLMLQSLAMDSAATSELSMK